MNIVNPYGPTLGMFREPDPWQNNFMFAQNPAAGAPEPSYGIGQGGEVQGSPAMQFQLTDPSQPASGTDWGAMAGALGGAAAKAGSAPQMPQNRSGGLPHASLGSAPREYQMQFIMPLAELAANREAAVARLRKK